MDVIDIALFKKSDKSIVSGIRNITSSGDTIRFTCNDGRTFDVKVSSGVIKVDWQASTKVLKITYANGTITEYDFSTISTPKEFSVNTANTTWRIQHNLNTPWYLLSFIIVDNKSNITMGDIDVDSCTNNLLVINFTEAISGKIIIR